MIPVSGTTPLYILRITSGPTRSRVCVRHSMHLVVVMIMMMMMIVDPWINFIGSHVVLNGAYDMNCYYAGGA